MIVFPNAKINIGLNITEKRPDGFHNIESCFYPIGWADALEILPTEQFKFESSGIAIPGNAANNLCTKAYTLLSKDHALPPVSMHLLKSIPIGAGLGGGSSDAAFAIKTLDRLFCLGITIEEQLRYARQLGSDCAFFISNQPAYCFNKGDEFDKINVALAGKWIVLVNPGIHISTVEAYAGILPRPSGQDLRITLGQPISDWKNTVKNDFETSLFPKYPILAEVKKKLYASGALYASMSGSGSTIYGIFEKEMDFAKELDSYRVWQGILM
jgi:4-diphosphocytidyl-2-C-methyl-D-erythritol kinase